MARKMDRLPRKWIDCRDYPDETGCTLYFSGEEDHVILAAVEHAVSFHGHERHAGAKGVVSQQFEGRNGDGTRLIGRWRRSPSREEVES